MRGELSIDHQGDERLTIHPHLRTDFLDAEQFNDSVVMLALVEQCILDPGQIAWCKAMIGDNITQLQRPEPPVCVGTSKPMDCRMRGEIERIDCSSASA